MARRRGWGDDGVYWVESRQRYVGAISVGYDASGKRVRKTVTGRTKIEVKDKLKALHADLNDGIRPETRYTVKDAIADWLDGGLDGRAERTIRLYRDMLKPIVGLIGSRQVRELSAQDVRGALVELAGDHSSRTVVIIHNALERAIRHAEANDHVRRNVVALVKPPTGQTGRPSKSLTLSQATSMIRAAKDSRLHAYVVLCLLAGVRTEEARALRWDHVDLEGDPDADPPLPPSVAVWRSVRAHGDVKTERSRRTLALPHAAVDALKGHHESQDADKKDAGDLWCDTGLVFASVIGTPLDAANVRREFKKITKAARVGDDWAPRELRTSFVSLMSQRGVSTEEIARLAGHSSSRTTEVIYRRELRPVIRTGAEVMDQLFASEAG